MTPTPARECSRNPGTECGEALQGIDGWVVLFEWQHEISALPFGIVVATLCTVWHSRHGKKDRRLVQGVLVEREGAKGSLFGCPV